MTPPFFWDVAAVRAAAWLVMVLCLIALLLILDIWKHRQNVRSPDVVVMTILTITVLAVGAIFAKVAWTGHYFPAVKEIRL